MLGWREPIIRGVWEKEYEFAKGVVYSEQNNYPHIGLPFYRDWNYLMEAVDFICGTLGYRRYSYTNEDHSRCVLTDMAMAFQNHNFGGGYIVIDSGKQNTEHEALFIAVSDFAKHRNEEAV
jgi:hypothetical protein